MDKNTFSDMMGRIIFYDASYAVGFLMMLLLSLIRCKAYGISRKRAAVYSVIAFLFGYGGARLIGVIYNALVSLKGVTTDVHADVLGAVIFTALLLPVAVFVEKRIRRYVNRNAPTETPAADVSLRSTMDMIIQGAFLVFACIKLGCHVRGCCMGVECSWGVMSPVYHRTLFPVQIFEFLSIIAIVIVCFYIKQTAFFRRGMGGPLAAWFYGFMRFCWEFLRYNTPELRSFALGLTLWQLFCLLVMVVAGGWVAVLYKTQPSEPHPKSRLPRLIEKKRREKIRREQQAANRAKTAPTHKKRKKKNSGAKKSR